MQHSLVDRRNFLKLASAGLVVSRGILQAAAANAATTAATATNFAKAESRSLSFYNLHTGENLSTVYWEKGNYIPEALSQVNRLLRDHRNGEVHKMSPGLLDALSQLSLRLETSKPFEIISGYRSPATNAMLRNEGHAVAKHSLHMDGLATDVRLADRSLEQIRAAAVAMKAGGVGYYPGQFVHVDVGRVRTW